MSGTGLDEPTPPTAEHQSRIGAEPSSASNFGNVGWSRLWWGSRYRAREKPGCSVAPRNSLGEQPAFPRTLESSAKNWPCGIPKVCACKPRAPGFTSAAGTTTVRGPWHKGCLPPSEFRGATGRQPLCQGPAWMSRHRQPAAPESYRCGAIQCQQLRQCRVVEAVVGFALSGPGKTRLLSRSTKFAW